MSGPRIKFKVEFDTQCGTAVSSRRFDSIAIHHVSVGALRGEVSAAPVAVHASQFHERGEHDLLRTLWTRYSTLRVLTLIRLHNNYYTTTHHCRSRGAKITCVRDRHLTVKFERVSTSDTHGVFLN